MTEEDELAAQEDANSGARLVQVRAVAQRPVLGPQNPDGGASGLRHEAVKPEPATSALPTGALCPGVEVGTPMPKTPATEATTPKPQGLPDGGRGKPAAHGPLTQTWARTPRT